MPFPEAPPVGTDAAGRYYPLDNMIDQEGRRHRGVVSYDAIFPIGLQVIQTTTPSMAVTVRDGSFNFQGAGFPLRGVGTANVTPKVIAAAPTDYPRVDLVTIYWDGAAAQIAVTTGAVTNNIPYPPAIPVRSLSGFGLVSDLVLATVMVNPGATAIVNEDIYDRRFFVPFEFTSGLTSGSPSPTNMVVSGTGGAVATGEIAQWNANGLLGPSGLLIASVGNVAGPASSIDGEVALFSGTTGKLLRRSTGTGVTRVTAGVQTAAELSGDVTTSGSNVVTIANDAVTYAKQQNVSAASRLLGRGSASGAGDCEEITLGTNLSMSGTTLNATGGGSADTLGVLASDASSTNNTLGNLTGVSVPIAGNSTEVWQVDLQFILANGSGGATADWKFGWSVPAGTTGFWGSYSNVAAQDEWGSLATGSVPSALLSEAQTKTFAGANTGVHGLHIWGTFYSGGTAGTLQCQFSQAVTNAAAQTVRRGSGGIFRKMLT